MVVSEQVSTGFYLAISNPNEREVLFRRSQEMVEAAKGMKAVVFLDKAARPLAYLYRKIHQEIYPEGQRPLIIFANIGSEKKDILERKVKRYYPDFCIKNGDIPLDYLRDRIDLVKIFGVGNVKQLERLLLCSGTGEKMIVDDVQATASTSNLALRIASIVDPESDYTFFQFLESYKDRKTFTQKGHMYPFLPWHETHKFVDESKDPRSFLAQRLSSRDLIVARIMRAGLDRIVREGSVGLL